MKRLLRQLQNSRTLQNRPFEPTQSPAELLAPQETSNHPPDACSPAVSSTSSSMPSAAGHGPHLRPWQTDSKSSIFQGAGVLQLPLLLFFVFCSTYLNASKVVIVSNWDLDSLPARFMDVRQEFDVHCVTSEGFSKQFSPFDPEIKKVIAISLFENMELVPKEKLVLFLWEPALYKSEFYDIFSAVYTWDDSLVDGIKFFRFNYPYVMPMQENELRFEDRKLCTLVAGNWVPHRLKVIGFFNRKPRGEFEFYGWNWWESIYGQNKMYMGPIPGSHSGNEKISVLKKYRFCICFENTIGLEGYITEKIFSCFAAGCIPIYWGAKNITEYIPKECFIDYRDFQNNEELYQYIKAMPKDVHEQYLQRIRQYLQSEQAQLFSPAYFDAVLYQAVRAGN